MIRKAKIIDIDRIIELLHQVCLVHHEKRPDYFKDSIKYNKEDLKRIIDNEEIIIFVYEENNQVLGYIFDVKEEYINHQLLTDRKTLYIDDLCVDENYRNKGIGKKLYLYTKEYAKKEGYHNVTLNVWALNDNALSFYKSLGLKPLKYYLEEIID